jgi:hypothetical protein
MRHEGKPLAEQSPLKQLTVAFKAVKRGKMPPIETGSLLQSMHLDGEEPDGLEFMDRLDGGQANLTDMRRSISLIFWARRLMKETNARTATPEQEALASLLGTVASRHLVREEDGCGVVTSLAIESLRPDIIDPEAKHIATRIQEDF